jgi:transposase
MKTSSLLFATDHLEELIKRLMPACLPLRLHELVVAADDVTLVLASCQSAACCPLCGQPITRAHSRYSRTLQDLPWGPLRVQLRIQVRRLLEKSIVLSVPMETNGQRSYLPSKRQTCSSVSFT